LDWITLVVMGIIYAVVEHNGPDIGPLVVQRPKQKHVTLKAMTTHRSL
jgi:hypothetical protein